MKKYTKVDAVFINDNFAYVVEHESKTRRLQSLIKPSVHNRIKEISKLTGFSVNEIVCKALEEYIVRFHINED